MQRTFPRQARCIFAISGTLPQLTDEFFEEGPPTLSGTKEVMCWKTQLHDQTGDLDVRIWDKPCYELFQITVEKLRSYWEDGNEHGERRPDILTVLNAQLGMEVICNCQATVWSYGYKIREHKMQINVNHLEVNHPVQNLD